MHSLLQGCALSILALDVYWAPMSKIYSRNPSIDFSVVQTAEWGMCVLKQEEIFRGVISLTLVNGDNVHRGFDPLLSLYQ